MAREGRSRNVVSRVLDWLRAGYPDGVPQQDYVALLGILRRHLTDEEIVEIVANVSINILTNYLNRVALTVVDFPEVKPGVGEATT